MRTIQFLLSTFSRILSFFSEQLMDFLEANLMPKLLLHYYGLITKCRFVGLNLTSFRLV